MTPDRYVPPPAIRQRAPAGDWLSRAACRGMDPELFFPERGESTDPAKAVCAGCSVRVECFDYALTNVERFGIWGGFSERERRAVRRSRARAARADRGAAA